MKLLVLFALIAATVAAKSNFGNRIVNGYPGDIKEFPYQVSILYDNSHNCGGSIISEKYIVTAAHCAEGFNKDGLTVRAGSSNHDEGGQLIEVLKYTIHDDYDSFTYDCDIAVMELKENIIFGEGAQPIELMDENNAIAGSKAYISGWGDLTEGGNTPKQLQYLDVPIMTNDECKNYYFPDEITENMLCAGYVDGTGDSCQGDSGGPLAYEGSLLGVVSWGNGCAQPGFPGVYSSVPVLRDFITKVTGL